MLRTDQVEGDCRLLCDFKGAKILRMYDVVEK